MRGERDWRDLFDLLDELPLGSRYAACLQEDMELAARQGRRPKHPPPDSPGWRGFDKHSYDFARITALLEQLLIAACKGDPSTAGITPWVPVPAVDKLKREQVRDRLQLIMDRVDAVWEGKEVH